MLIHFVIQNQTSATRRKRKYMSKCLMEQLGVSYTEVDGILYPQVNCEKESKVLFGRGGKYGYLWISYMKENYPDRYKTLERVRRISETGIRVNDEAYDLLDATVEAYLKIISLKIQNPR